MKKVFLLVEMYRVYCESLMYMTAIHVSALLKTDEKVPYFLYNFLFCQFIQFLMQVHPAFIPLTMTCFALTAKQQNKVEKKIMILYSRTIISYNCLLLPFLYTDIYQFISIISNTVLFLLTWFKVIVNIWIRDFVKNCYRNLL